jgi:hypothetical protein
MKRTANADEKRHLAKVAAMGCIVCSECLGYEGTPSQVHHVRVEHGWGRSGHFNTIPLCPTHHQSGALGVHDMGREEFKEMYGMSELELLEIVKGKLV